MVNIYGDKELLYQVGKTVNKEVIDKKQFYKIINEIKNKLDLRSNDNLLDLCCGNGVLTYALAKYVHFVVGIDFSLLYINNAKRFKSAENILYRNYDVKQLENLRFDYSFTKVLMYDALAYFTRSDLDKLLRRLKEITSPGAKFFFGSVLDDSKKWNFFNTPKRKFYYYFNLKFLGQDKGLGKWWGKEEIREICEKNNLQVRFSNQGRSIYTSHYRMDLIIYN